MADNELRVVILEADSYRERGRIHGETLRDLIIEHQLRWEKDLKENVDVDVSDYLDQLLGETNFMPAIERWTPYLLEEVKGIAEGANIDFRYVLARQLSDEEPWFRLEKRLAATAGRGCSSIGLDYLEDRPTIIGQNMDSPAWYYGHQVLFHHKGPDMAAEVFSFSLAGKISLCGMNSKGLAICCNTLNQLDYAKDGLPEDFVVRGFLAQSTLKAGLEFMHEIKHASGQNYTLAEPGSRAINLEVSANKIVEFSLGQKADYVCHTNHAIVNDDQAIREHQRAMGYNVAAVTSTSTINRLKELKGRLGETGKTLSVDDMKKAFSSHVGPVCRHPGDSGGGNVITMGCLIMELGQELALHIASGPPCVTPFTTYKFDA